MRGARPLRVRVGVFVVFAAQGRCWLSEDAPGVNGIIEAMACGTPVFATLVGAIPDVIKNGETGFLMENNSPKCIAANVIRALESSDLEGVAQRARALVEREFTYERAVEGYRSILACLR
jgi:Glycosyltransferase